MTTVVKLTEWRTVGPKQIPALRIRLPDDARGAVELLRKTRRLEIVELRDGLQISTRSYVGAVTIGPLTLHIAPKIAPAFMPSFMRYALGLERIGLLDDTLTPLSSRGFLDLLAIVLLSEVDHLMHAGLAQDYRPVEEWTGAPKGSIRFSALARNPIRSVTALPCRFNRRSADVPLNRLTLACLSALRPTVSDTQLAFDLHARAAVLGEFCQYAPLTRGLLSEAAETLDRRTSYYQPIVNIAEFVLAGLGVGFQSEQNAQLPGHLFDMNALFERFVARLCREYAAPALIVETQETNATSYYMTSNPHHWQAPRLRPDIVVRDRYGEPKIILDTKYKRFGPNARPSPSDIYQMTLYSIGFARTSPVPARIVYPSDSGAISETRLAFRGDHNRRGLADVRIYALDVEACATAIQANDKATLKSLVAHLLTTE